MRNRKIVVAAALQELSTLREFKRRTQTASRKNRLIMDWLDWCIQHGFPPEDEGRVAILEQKPAAD